MKNNILFKLLKNTSLLILVGISVCIILVCIILSKCIGSDNTNEIIIEPTPNQIIKIMPQNEMYVATAIIEDLTTLQKTEYHLSIFPEEHSCVQILRQKVSFKIDLGKVEYIPKGNHKMTVRMPQLEYTASTQTSPFISDNEEYWQKNLVSTYELKNKVENQIRSRFDTDENRSKALLYAEEAIKHILTKLGYETEFISSTIVAPANYQ